MLLVGILFSSLGVGFSLKSSLGATPVGVCPAVFSEPFNISVGTAMAIMLAVFFIIQIILLKKDFKPFEFLQFAATIVYSSSVDLWGKSFHSFLMNSYGKE